MKKLLFIAPHPDDELLGCGGVIDKFKNKQTYWLILTNISEKSGYSKIQIKRRYNEIQKIKKKLNFNYLEIFDFDPASLKKSNLNILIKKMSNVINKIKPDTIFSPHLHDAHSDHYFCTYTLNHILKSFRYPFIEKCYLYETLSETNFNFTNKKKFMPNTYFDITKNLKKKIMLMKIYKSEIKKHPFPRSVESIKSLATLRGSESGFRYAESFQLLFAKKK